MAPAVMRGLSEANGSWNTSCIRAAGPHLARRQAVDRAPLEADLALGGLDEPQQQRGRAWTCRSPLADDRECLALRTPSVTPSTAAHRRAGAAERLSEPAPSRMRSPSVMLPPSPAARPAPSAGGGVARAEPEPAAAPRPRSAGRRTGSGSEAAALRHPPGPRHRAPDRRQAAAAPPERGQRAHEADGVRVLRVLEAAATGPCSTIRPAYITATSSAVSATTPRSCVTRITAVPLAPCNPSIRASIWAWIVTSSAVVGSSAISRAGRRRAPSRSSPAAACRPRAGADSAHAPLRRRYPHPLQHLERPPAGGRRDAPRWRTTTSAIWAPIVKAGLSEVIGSWKIIAISSPRRSARSRSGSASRSRPLNSARPPLSSAGGCGRRPMSASDVRLLPQPISPTMASVRPASSRKETASTRFSRWLRKPIAKPSTSSSASAGKHGLPLAIVASGRHGKRPCAAGS